MNDGLQSDLAGLLTGRIAAGCGLATYVAVALLSQNFGLSLAAAVLVVLTVLFVRLHRSL